MLLQHSQTPKESHDLLNAGWLANQAWHAAKIVARWYHVNCGEHDTPEVGSCRLRSEPELERYWGVYGTPEPYTDERGKIHSIEDIRKEVNDRVERDGMWCIVSEWYDGDNWNDADNIGMCIGANQCDPIENWYVPDLMYEAMRQAQDFIDDIELTLCLANEMGEMA